MKTNVEPTAETPADTNEDLFGDPIEPKVSEVKKRNCDHCGKEYEYNSAKSRFCTNSCRARNAEKIKDTRTVLTAPSDRREREHTPVKPAIFTSSNTLDPQTTFIIAELTRSRDAESEKYKEERERRKKMQDRVIELEKQLQEEKHRNEIEKITNAKPSGLSGLGENPLVHKLVEYIGPAIGAVAMKMANGAESPAGALQGLDEEGKAQVEAIAEWFASLPKALQESVNNMLFSIGQIDQSNLHETISRIQNLLTNGTTAHNTSAPRATRVTSMYGS